MIGETFARNPSPAPPWTKDMVIYEVNPRTLATDHFYGVWSVYATWRPDQLDPALGSESASGGPSRTTVILGCF